VQLARVAACSEGRHQVDGLDLWLAPYVLPARTDAIPELQALLLDDILHAPPSSAPWLERAVQAFEQQLRVEEQTPAEGPAGHDDSAGKAALARSIGLSSGLAGDEPASGPTRLVSARLEERQRKRWGAVHVQARLAQLDELMGELQVHLERVQQAQDQRAQALQARLWCPTEWVSTVLGRYEEAAQQLALSLQKLASARQGFAALPVDEGPSGDAQITTAPEPVRWGAAA
jgi:MoxR-like ATPase